MAYAAGVQKICSELTRLKTLAMADSKVTSKPLLIPVSLLQHGTTPDKFIDRAYRSAEERYRAADGNVSHIEVPGYLLRPLLKTEAFKNDPFKRTEFYKLNLAYYPVPISCSHRVDLEPLLQLKGDIGGGIDADRFRTEAAKVFFTRNLFVGKDLQELLHWIRTLTSSDKQHIMRLGAVKLPDGVRASKGKRPSCHKDAYRLQLNEARRQVVNALGIQLRKELITMYKGVQSTCGTLKWVTEEGLERLIFSKKGEVRFCRKRKHEGHGNSEESVRKRQKEKANNDVDSLDDMLDDEIFDDEILDDDKLDPN